MSDLDRYQQLLQEQHREWEARCTHCGVCCGALEDPCENLRKSSSGKYFCSVYERRLGTWRTVSGKSFECVMIRDKLARGESWPGDEHCGYKKRGKS